MIELKLESCPDDEALNQSVSISFHSSFYFTYKKLKSWMYRFSHSFGDTVVNDLVLLFSLAKKKYLDHRDPSHLLRLVVSIYHMQRKLLSSCSITSQARHLHIRWIPTKILFPFSSKPVLGCLIGFNLMDRYELFDEENVVVFLQKHFPDIQMVKESYYHHNSQHANLKILYFEVEKKNGFPFSLAERKSLKINLEEKIKNSIQKLVPAVFMKFNQEEVYKNILILSQEISSVLDFPQVYITLEQHSSKGTVFHVNLVLVSPFSGFSMKDRLFGCSFSVERILPVRYLDGQQIEAHLFRILFPPDTSLLRSDGSLDFYAARQKVVNILTGAIGEFRDYNGGLLIKQQELLFSFKQNLPEEVARDSELMETFFHSLFPLEKQALLDPKVLSALFVFFLEHSREQFSDILSFKTYQEKQKIYLSVRGSDDSITEVIKAVLRKSILNTKDMAYNILDTAVGTFFNCVLLTSSCEQVDPFIHSLQESLHLWSQKKNRQQNLRIAISNPIFSLDPRVGVESPSSDVLRLLFEGLTRIDQDGNIENAVAESIEVTPDLKHYTFKLRSCFWNDGTLVSAHDFAYSWKKVLSPDFETSFAALFYPIKNAKETKIGMVPIDQIGIHVVNDRTLRVDLVRPTPYFLQLTALPIFAPVHRLVDEVSPQWPYQAEKNYPCNGPFQLKINNPNQGYQLVKNPLYWESEKIELDQVTLTLIDPFPAMQAFARNEIDLLGNPFGPWHSAYTQDQDARSLSCPEGSIGWSIFNTNIAPFNNVKMRHAFALAFDRTEFTTNVGISLTSSYSILPSRYSDKGNSIFPKTNREKALLLFEEALAELGWTRSDLSIHLTFPQKGTHEFVSSVLSRQIIECFGIQCKLQPLTWNAFFRKMTEGNFQIGLMNWAMLIDDPIYTLNVFKFADEGINFSKWENVEFQQLLDSSEEEVNPFQRAAMLLKAETILAQEMPIVPLFFQPYQLIVRKNFFINQSPRGILNIARRF